CRRLRRSCRNSGVTERSTTMQCWPRDVSRSIPEPYALFNFATICESHGVGTGPAGFGGAAGAAGFAAGATGVAATGVAGFVGVAGEDAGSAFAAFGSD